MLFKELRIVAEAVVLRNYPYYDSSFTLSIPENILNSVIDETTFSKLDRIVAMKRKELGMLGIEEEEKSALHMDEGEKGRIKRELNFYKDLIKELEERKNLSSGPQA